MLVILDESITYVINKAQTDKEFQTKLYVIGGILGQGIREGVGLQKGGPQKFKIGDLVMQFLSGGMKLPFGGEQPAQRPQQSSNMPSA
jgi:hypothetical protein